MKKFCYKTKHKAEQHRYLARTVCAFGLSVSGWRDGWWWGEGGSCDTVGNPPTSLASTPKYYGFCVRKDHVLFLNILYAKFIL